MQYARTFEEYEDIMTTHNGGDYACSWLLGNVNTNEIMLFELGQKYKTVKRTRNGAFYAVNSAIGKELREHETNDRDFNDITTSSGNRTVRMKELLHKENQSKITVEIAKDIISDHYDATSGKQKKTSRGICSHTEEDPDNPHLYGSVDAKVVNTDMAKKLMFQGRFGSACGRTFSMKEFLKKRPEFTHWESVTADFPKYDWVSVSNS